MQHFEKCASLKSQQFPSENFKKTWTSFSDRNSLSQMFMNDHIMGLTLLASDKLENENIIQQPKCIQELRKVLMKSLDLFVFLVDVVFGW